MGGGNETELYTLYPLSSRVSVIVNMDPFELPLIYCVAGDDRMVVIDTGCAPGDLRSFIQKFSNPRSLPILVVCTHSHHDHMGCNFQFAEASGNLPPGSLGVALSGANKEFTLQYNKWSYAEELGYDLKPFTVTRWLQDGEQIPLSDNNLGDSLAVLWVPGHGPDAIALYHPVERRLFVGDVINRYAPICWFNYGASFEQSLVSLDKLIAFVEARNGFDPNSLIMLSAGHEDENLHPKYLKDLKALAEKIIAGKLVLETLTPRVSCYNRGGEMWLTVCTKPGEKQSFEDVLAGIGAMDGFRSGRNG